MFLHLVGGMHLVVVEVDITGIMHFGKLWVTQALSETLFAANRDACCIAVSPWEPVIVGHLSLRNVPRPVETPLGECMAHQNMSQHLSVIFTKEFKSLQCPPPPLLLEPSLAEEPIWFPLEPTCFRKSQLEAFGIRVWSQPHLPTQHLHWYSINPTAAPASQT